MSFQKIEKSKRSEGVKNRVGVFCQQGQLRIVLSPDVVAGIGSPERVHILIGDGEDTGKVLLRPTSDNTGFSVSPAGKRLRAVNMRAALVNFPSKMPITDCEFMVSGTDLIVVLPGARAQVAAA